MITVDTIETIEKLKNLKDALMAEIESGNMSLYPKYIEVCADWLSMVSLAESITK